MPEEPWRSCKEEGDMLWCSQRLRGGRGGTCLSREAGGRGLGLGKPAGISGALETLGTGSWFPCGGSPPSPGRALLATPTRAACPWPPARCLAAISNPSGGLLGPPEQQGWRGALPQSHLQQHLWEPSHVFGGRPHQASSFARALKPQDLPGSLGEEGGTAKRVLLEGRTASLLHPPPYCQGFPSPHPHCLRCSPEQRKPLCSQPHTLGSSAQGSKAELG